MDATEIQRIQNYLRGKFNAPAIELRARTNKDDSVEVYLGDEFLGVIFKDLEDDELAYQFNMAILDIDLAEFEG